MARTARSTSPTTTSPPSASSSARIPRHVEAIRILLDRPQDWSTDALTELRTKLLAAPQRFTPENLQKAHEIQYHKALVDIISMVKHAADEQHPLLTASERVEQAFKTVTAGRDIHRRNSEQWLDRIREHLRENLTIDQEDFETAARLLRASAAGVRFQRYSVPELPHLIKQLNEAIAA